MLRTTLLSRFVRLSVAGVVAVAATTALSAQAPGPTYEIVSSFDLNFGLGRAPSSIRQNSDGTLYGTTMLGGTFDKGTVFRVDAGVVTPIYNFAGGFNGAQPFGLVRTPDGRFYGMTSTESSFGFGSVFALEPDGTPTTLHAFSTDERAPVDLFAASDGNVYGLTAFGGDFDNGTIFRIDPSGAFSTVISIPLGAGSNVSSLVRGDDGRFFLAARYGGTGSGFGYGILSAIEDGGTVTILHQFTGGPTDGEAPVGLMQSRDGTLYGTTFYGGEFFDGIAYAVDPGGNYRVLQSFNTVTLGPDIVEASDGSLYGVTITPGTLFRINASGEVTTVTDLSGSSPSSVIEGGDGSLYILTAAGGRNDGGSLRVRDSSGRTSTLYDFDTADGQGRPNSVMQASTGVFYGTTVAASSMSTTRRKTGTVFSMDTAGTRATLHTFFTVSPFIYNEGSPAARLLEGADGTLYGTTFNPNNTVTPAGQIFRLNPAGSFAVIAGQWWLRAGLIQARDGRLYGTSSGGVVNTNIRTYGEIFRIEANGTRTTLHTFNGTDSAGPSAELLEVDDGSLYGTTAGGAFPGAGGAIPAAIFRIDPATGAFAIRHVFSGDDGAASTAPLIRGTDGLLYGTTSGGGANGFGTVFSFDTAASTLTTLHHFAGSDGANPGSGLLHGQDGRLYGLTQNGGAFGYGTVFVINTTGGLTTLHDFALSDGGNPTNELIQASDGALYGAAPMGGPDNGGVIFRVRLEATPPPTGDYFQIVSRNSGKCLDVYGASTDIVAPVIQWTCHGGANQQWRLEPAGGGAFRIIVRHSGQALDVYGAFVDDLTPLIQYPVTGGDNQAWTLEPASDGYVRLVVRHSGKAMDVEGASIDDGARVIQYTPHGAANQQWLLRPVN